MIETIIIVILAILFAISLYVSRREYQKSLYFYPKNKHFYTFRHKCRIKNPTSGEWVDAVIYQDIKSGNYYARELSDFLAKFVSYKDFNSNGYK